MCSKSSKTDLFADFLLNTFDKKDIISEVFNFFKIDCIERCRYNPSSLDNMINIFLTEKENEKENLCSIISYIKGVRSETIKKENDLLKTIISYIENNLGEDISIEETAKNMNISYFYLCHMFKENYGISITTFRTQKRLEMAVKMLMETKYSISDIAGKCGFNNLSYFTETFTKHIGISPTKFKREFSDLRIHNFYDFNDIRFAIKTKNISFLSNNIKDIKCEIETFSVYEPNDEFCFLHEAAIIEYNGVLFASWYNCPEKELVGYTPIIGKRSYDGGKTWSLPEVICSDPSEKIMYCPPAYGIYDNKLYMFVNQMVAPDHIHSLDLYILNAKTDKFELLWSKPIPFKINTNVVRLPNGKLMLPGRIAELDSFPNTPAIMISDSGKIDSEWRIVKIAENGILPDNTEFVHPEISVICAENKLYMFSRNDQRKVPLVYLSKDYGETWSTIYSHDIPYVSSKIYCGDLADGRHYIICNTDKPNRTKLTIYFTNDNTKNFTKKLELFDIDKDIWGAMHYPAACEYNGYLFIIATKGYENGSRGAILYKINLKEI